MLLLIRMRSVCIQLNTNVIRGLVKRAQLLGNVHSTTSPKCAHIEYLKRLGRGGETRYTQICIYIYIILCMLIYSYVNTNNYNYDQSYNYNYDQS